MDSKNTGMQTLSDHDLAAVRWGNFLLGLVTGGVVGALVMWWMKS